MNLPINILIFAVCISIKDPDSEWNTCEFARDCLTYVQLTRVWKGSCTALLMKAAVSLEMCV